MSAKFAWHRKFDKTVSEIHFTLKRSFIVWYLFYYTDRPLHNASPRPAYSWRAVFRHVFIELKSIFAGFPGFATYYTFNIVQQLGILSNIHYVLSFISLFRKAIQLKWHCRNNKLHTNQFVSPHLSDLGSILAVK